MDGSRAIRYELIAKMGRTPMGETFSVWRHGELGFRRRVTLLCPSYPESGPASSSGVVLPEPLAKALSLGSRLRHPNVMGLLDVDLWEGRLCLVCEEVDGVDLETFLRHAKATGSRLEPSVLQCIGQEALRGLAFAQYLQGFSEGVLHRHLEPQRIHLSALGEIKLEWPWLEPGWAEGPYAAPEVRNAKTGGPSADLFSFGAILLEALSGRSPHPELLPERLLEQEAEPLGRFKPLLDRCLATDAQQRFQSPDELLEAFLQVAPPAPDGRERLAERVLRLLGRKIPSRPSPLKSEGAASPAEARPSQQVPLEGQRIRREWLPALPVESPSEARKSPPREPVDVAAMTAPGLEEGPTASPEAAGTGVSAAPIREVVAELKAGGVLLREEGPGIISFPSEARVIYEATKADASEPARSASVDSHPSPPAPLPHGEDGVGAFVPELSPPHVRRRIWPAVLLLVLIVGGGLSVGYSTWRPTAPRELSAQDGKVASRPALPESAAPGEVRWVEGVEMVSIAAGPFRSGKGTSVLEVPAFSIDRFEVTHGQYAAFLDACPPGSSCGPKTLPPHLENRPWGQIVSASPFPVSSVSFADARAYCAWRKMRLPTSMEWEKAARGVDGRLYPWGSSRDEARSKAWIDVVPAMDLERPLGLLSLPVTDARLLGDVSPYGVMDMAGNVAEFTADVSPGAGVKIGGGSFIAGSTGVVADFRFVARDGVYPDIGFRCAVDEGEAVRLGGPLLLARIKAHGQLRIGMELETPFLERAPSGEYQGITVAFADAMAKRLGVKRVIVEGHPEDLAPLLAEDALDLLVGGANPEAKVKGVAWTRPFLESGVSLVVHVANPLRTPEAFAGHLVAVEASLGEDMARALVPGAYRYVLCQEDCFARVAAMQVEALLADEARAMVEAANDPRLRITAFNLRSRPYRFGLREGEWTGYEGLERMLEAELGTPMARTRVLEHFGSLALGVLGPVPTGAIWVQRGDTLAILATRGVGDAERLPDLLEANGDWLDETVPLKPGMFLRPPASR